HAIPPAANRLNRELGRVAIDAHVDPPFVAHDVVDAVRDRFAKISIDEVVGAYGLRVALRLPLPSVVVEVADQLLFLGVDRDHRLTLGVKLTGLAVDVPKLSVTVQVVRTFAGFAQRLQAVAEL